MNTPVPGTVYRHFKGGLYLVTAVATDANTGVLVVVYASLKDGRYWTRPLAEFTDHVEREGYSGPRFSREPS